MRVPTIPGRIEESPLEFALAETSLSVRTLNALDKAGILTVKELLETPEEFLLDLKNFGHKALKEIHRAMKDLGIKYEPPRQMVAA